MFQQEQVLVLNHEEQNDVHVQIASETEELMLEHEGLDRHR